MYFLLPLFLANAHCMATGNMPGHRWYPTERSPSSTLSFASDPNPYNLGTSKSHVAVTCCSSIKLSAFMQRIKCQLRGPFLCVCLLRHSWLHSNQWHSRNWWSHSRVSESPCMCSVYHKHPLSCSKTRMHLAVSHIVRAFYFSCWKTLIFFFHKQEQLLLHSEFMLHLPGCCSMCCSNLCHLAGGRDYKWNMEILFHSYNCSAEQCSYRKEKKSTGSKSSPPSNALQYILSVKT